MKVHFENISGTERKLFVEIPQETVDAELDKLYKSYQRNVRIRGFRPGHVPRNVIDRLYRREIEGDLITGLIKTTLEKALDETKLRPISEPQLDSEPYEAGKPFKYSLQFDIKPEPEIIIYKGLKVKKHPDEVIDEDVEMELTRVREGMAEYIPVEDRGADIGDQVLVDYEGSIDGKPVKILQGKDKPFYVGQPSYLPGFADHLTGTRKDEERSFTIPFPEAFSLEQVAGKEALFNVKVKEIKTKKLPELDDELAKDLGNYETLADLRKSIRERLKTAKEQHAQRLMKDRLLEKVVALNDFEAPKSMVDVQLESLVRQQELSFLIQGLDPDKAGLDREKVKEELRPRAAEQVKAYIAVESIARQEEIAASEADVEKAIEEIAKNSVQNIAKVKARYSNEKERESLKFQILENKVLDLLFAEAHIVPESESDDEEIVAGTDTTPAGGAETAQVGEGGTEVKPGTEDTAEAKPNV